MSMSCELALLKSHQKQFTSLRSLEEIEAAGNSTAKALGHTVKVCCQAVATARMIQFYPKDDLEVKGTSLQRRVPGTVLNNRPSREVSEQALYDLKKVSRRVRELQRLDQVQQGMFKSMGEALEEEIKLCSDTVTAQEKFEQDLQATHRKMFRADSDAPFIYFNRPGKARTGHTVADEFKRFSADAAETLEKKNQQVTDLGAFQIKLMSRLNGQGIRVNLETIKALAEELHELVGATAPVVVQEEDNVELLDNEPVGRDSSNHSSAEALRYAEAKLKSLKALLTIGEEPTKPAMTDDEVAARFPLSVQGYLFQEQTLTEDQFNELADELESMINECNTLTEKLEARKGVLSNLAETLEKDSVMLEQVKEAEQEVLEQLNAELQSQTHYTMKGVEDRGRIANMTEAQVCDLVEGDKRAEEDLRVTKRAILELLKQIQEKNEQAVEESVTPAAAPVAESVAVEQQRQRRLISEKIREMVELFERLEKENS